MSPRVYVHFLPHSPMCVMFVIFVFLAPRCLGPWLEMVTVPQFYVQCVPNY